LRVDHRDAAEVPVVGGLAAALRVEQGVVEHGVGPAVAVADPHHPDLQPGEVRITLVGRGHRRWFTHDRSLPNLCSEIVAASPTTAS
jgi:hypothetical protein